MVRGAFPVGLVFFWVFLSMSLVNILFKKESFFLRFCNESAGLCKLHSSRDPNITHTDSTKLTQKVFTTRVGNFRNT